MNVYRIYAAGKYRTVPKSVYDAYGALELAARELLGDYEHLAQLTEDDEMNQWRADMIANLKRALHES